MAKKEEGVVVEVKEQYAFLKAMRHSSCKSCGACPGDNATIIKAYNKVKAEEGDLVYFKINETAMIKATFIVFILPLLLIFIGAWAVPVILSTYTQVVPTTIHSVAGGTVGLILGIVGIRLANKYIGNHAGNLPIVTDIKGKVFQG